MRFQRRGWKPLLRSAGYGAGSPGHEKTPRPDDGEWGWKDGWFSEAGLLAATEDECESTEAEKGGGGGLGDGDRISECIDVVLEGAGAGDIHGE